jgi:capsule polysaccharide export protein KpsE/RkpR
VLRARQTVDLARANAAVQHFYIEPYVTPELPESPTYPMRALDTCLAGLAIFGAWLLGLLLVRTIQDHAV